MKKFAILASILIMLWAVPHVASAQSVGVFCWQLAPLEDEFCFDIVATSGNFAFALTGADHLPGSFTFGAHGAAAFDESFNSIEMDFTSGGVHYQASLDPLTLDGVWNDDQDATGDFLFLGRGPFTQATPNLFNVR